MRTANRRSAPCGKPPTLAQKQEAAARRQVNEQRRRREALAYTLLANACIAMAEHCGMEGDIEGGIAMAPDAADFPGAMRVAHKYLNQARALLSGEATP